MTAVLQPGDYALLAIAAAFAIIGFFRGLSGMLAFCLACAAAAACGVFGWRESGLFISALWLRVVAVVAATLLSFGAVRFAVRKLVGGLLAGPSDALFGMLAGLALAALLLAAWAFSNLFLEYSFFASEVAGRVW